MKNAIRILLVIVLLALLLGVPAWWKLHHVSAQPSWITSNPRDLYFYGAVGGGGASGVPYWMWLAMPRLFPEHLSGPGGYAALGISWEEGREMQVGFAKRKVGYLRVTGNCALCHAVSTPNGNDQAPAIHPFSGGRTTDIGPLLAFYRNCAQDPRFNPDEFFSEIDDDTKLSIADRLLYRYFLIPRIKRALIEDPAGVLLPAEIRAHARDPHSVAPLSDQQMKDLANWMKLEGQRPTP